MIERAIIDKATKWLQSRIPSSILSTIEDVNLSAALSELSSLPQSNATFLIQDIFPTIDLEVLYVHNCSPISELTTRNANEISGNCTVATLTAIGTAIKNEMITTGTEVLSFSIDSSSEIIIYLSSVRSTVLQATGTTILPNAAI